MARIGQRVGGSLRRRALAALVALLAAGLAAGEVQLWTEAEAYTEQAGSTAPRYAMPGASGGFIVDNDWGGRESDFLRYRVTVPALPERVWITFRYARAMAGDAVVLVQFEGQPGPPGRLALPETGGWGFQEAEWNTAGLDLSAPPAGEHVLTVRSTRAGNNVNFDGFFLTARPVPVPPALVEDPALREEVARLGPMVFVVQAPLDNPDGVVRLPSRPIVRQWGCRILRRAGDGTVRELYRNPDAAILDLNASLDAGALFFAMQTRAEPFWHLYEIGADGRGLRQITRGPYHDFGAAELPGGDLVFASSRVRSFNLCAQEFATALFRVRRDGTGLRQVTVNTLNDLSPQVLPDGRILYTRWEYVDRDVKWRQSLWTVNPDGTNVQLFFGNTIRDPAVFWQARPVPGSDEVVATFAPHHGWPLGAIGTVTRRHGVEAPRTRGFQWITAEYPSIGDNGGLPQWAYRDPYPLAPDRFLVSYGGGRRAGDRRFRIWLLSSDDRKALAWDEGRESAFFPVALVPRPVPHVHSEVVWPEGVRTGTLVLRNVYAGLGDSVRPGEIKALRIMEQVPKFPENETGFPANRVYEMCPVLGQRCYYVKRCLGVVPVEADGSAHFEVPAFRELYFQALDAEGRAVQSMGSATNLVPGEQQSCIGCHEDRDAAPPAGRALAASRAPDSPQPYAWGNGGNIAFPVVVQPVLDRHCLRCHEGPAARGRLDLSGDRTRWFSMAYDNLFRRNMMHTIILTQNDGQVIPPKQAFSYASRLRDVIEARHPEHTGLQLSREERERFYVWMDSNANYYGTYQRTRPGTRGDRDLWAGPWFADGFLPLYRERCVGCHGSLGDAAYPSDSWVINLSRPRHSPALLAHLAKAAGGWGIDQAKDGKAPPSFGTDQDPVWQGMLRAIEQGREAMLAQPRMDMPGAVAVAGPDDWGRWRGSGDPAEPVPGRFWGAASIAAAAGADASAAPAAPAGVTRYAQSIAAGRDRISLTVYVPARVEATTPVAWFVHGFLRRQGTMAGWAAMAADLGLVGVAVDTPTVADHARNAAIAELLELADQGSLQGIPAGSHRRYLVGFSAGGLSSLLAAAVRPERTAFWIGLDPVDIGDLGVAAMARLRCPVAILRAEPSAWNAHGNARRLWDAAQAPALHLVVSQASHADLENPYAPLAGLVCGTSGDAQREVFRTLVGRLLSLHDLAAPSGPVWPDLSREPLARHVETRAPAAQ